MAIIKKMLVKVIVWGAIFDLALILIVVMVNLPLFDEKLHPELEKIQQLPKQPVLENNAFVLFHGFDAPDSDDHLLASQQITLSRYDRSQLGKAVFSSEELQAAKAADADLLSTYPAAKCRVRNKPGCLSELVSQVADKPLTDNKRYQLLKGRYLELQNIRNFNGQGYLTWESQLPAYNRVIQVGNLIRAELYLQEDISSLIKFLNDDEAFWRMLLNQKSSLVAKMVAISRLWGTALVRSELINQKRVFRDDLLAMNTKLKLLSRDEIDISEAFLHELKVTVDVERFWSDSNLGWFETTIKRMATQTNAYLNDYYHYEIVPVLELSALNSKEFADRTNPFSLSYDKFTFSPTSIFNLAGKFDMNKTIKHRDYWFDYMSRARNLEGVYRLYAIQLAYNLGHPIDELLEREALTNPYTEKAMNFNPESMTLSFECLGKKFGLCELKL